MEPIKLFDDALARVESPSVREWADSARNRPIWIKIAEKKILKNDQENEWPDSELVTRMVIDIVSTAIGL